MLVSVALVAVTVFGIDSGPDNAKPSARINERVVDMPRNGSLARPYSLRVVNSARRFL